MDTIRFKGDSATRRRFFQAESFQHPAKMHCGLFLECLERYTKPGDLVLDPMAGSGTALLGAMYGRHMILNELELHFLIPMLASWKKIQQNGPALGYPVGQAMILRGDARALPLCSADAVITSPPYEGIVADNKEGPNQTSVPGGWKANTVDKHGGYTRPAAIITSPPYEGSVAGESSGGIDWAKQADGRKKQEPHGVGAHPWGYTRPAAIITSPPYEGSLQGDERSGKLFQTERRVNSPASGNCKSLRKPLGYGYTRPQVDAVVTSPPFSDIEPFQDKKFMLNNDKANYSPYHQVQPVSESRPSPTAYSDSNAENIGNLRNAAYWDAMRQVYAECWRVLRPGGIMALVLGNFVRNGLIIDLVSDTIDLCKQQGFQEIDHWQRVKWSLSFWRILQARRGGPVIDREDVVAFRKPYPGNGSAASSMEKGISPFEPSPPVQWHLSSAKLIKDPSPQLPLSLPKEE